MAVVGLTLPHQVVLTAKMEHKTIQAHCGTKREIRMEKKPCRVIWKKLPLLPFTPLIISNVFLP